MKKLRNRILIVTLGMTVFSAVVIATFGLVSTFRVTRDSVNEIMRYRAVQGSEEITSIMDGLSQTVDTIYEYGMEVLPPATFYSDETKMRQFNANIYKLMHAAIVNEEAAIAAYWRFNDELDMGTRGFFITRTHGTIKAEPLTDYLKYPKEDIVHTGWYYIPIEAGEPVWVGPYHNENLEIPMVSYEIPFYLADGTPFGVVGMDIRMSKVLEAVENIQIYEGGEVFLLGRDMQTMYTMDYPEGVPLEYMAKELGITDIAQMEDNLFTFKRNNRRWMGTSYTLPDNSNLFVTAPVREIYAPFIQLAEIEGFVILLVLLLTTFLMVDVTSRITSPLERLKQVAEEISKKNFDVNFPEATDDEVGALTSTLKETVQEIKQYTGTLKSEAYTDSMTGLGNINAFEVASKRVFGHNTKDVAIFVFDFNNLKITNDTYGHSVGDAMIVTGAEILGQVFGERNVFRTGGDEFVAMLSGVKEDAIEDYISILEVAVENFNSYGSKEYDVPLSIAAGGASLKPGMSIGELMDAADAAMYSNKNAYKEGQET